MEAVGVAQLIASGLSTQLPQLGKYTLEGGISWCGKRQLDPVHCPVYVTAIFAFHVPLESPSLGRHPLVSRLLRSVLWLRPPVCSRVPTWDLAVVLEALCKPLFEPLEEISDRFLSLKTAFLLAISSLKRVGDLQALSVAPSYLDFAPGMAKAFLHLKPGYVPKVPSSVPWSIVLEAFSPPPFREPEQHKLNCMCPLRALDAYVYRAALWRKTDQLFVCFGPYNKGQPASRQTLRWWIMDARVTLCL
ncbi:Ribonuclease HII [Labeo rohita]|uniref:Ribonuclease HII n=1 Tax=Labeo rohita TaxID=84645 RepID=A0ABQ8LHL0_LABRO|nr:Ribonuclease HII [Labeo rohita]